MSAPSIPLLTTVTVPARAGTARRASLSSDSASNHRSFLALSGATSAGAEGSAHLELAPVRSRTSLPSPPSASSSSPLPALSFQGGKGLDMLDSRRTIRRDGVASKGIIMEEEDHQAGDDDASVSKLGHEPEQDRQEEPLEQVQERQNDHRAEKMQEEKEAQRMYDRFTERRKQCIVAIVAYAALLAPFASSSFLPSIPSIVIELNTSPSIVNLSIAIFLTTLAVCPLVWAPYAGIYGRKPIYVTSLPIFTIGSFCTARSSTLAALMISRVIQGAGASAVLSVGAGTIGDLYPRSRRGRAMGLFYLGILVGPATAPAIAGILTEYVQPYGSGWRSMQYLLFAMGLIACLLVTFFLPETSHTRGIDLIREERARVLAARSDEEIASAAMASISIWDRRKDVVLINPLATLRILVNPHILAMSLNSAFVLMSVYAILVPLAYTLAPRYNITNAAILGCLYLASGFGNISATRYTGRYADYVLRRYAFPDGTYPPEHRLYAALIGSGLILPLAVLALGWIIEKGSGIGGFVGALILLFCNGVGLMCILTSTNTYCVDVMQGRSAEVIAVNNFVRYMACAGASAGVLPLIMQIGVGWTNTLAAALCWLGFALVLLVIRYGEKLRELGKRWEALEEDECEHGQIAVEMNKGKDDKV